MRLAEVIVLQHYHEIEFREVYKILNGKGNQVRRKQWMFKPLLR